MCSYGKDTKVLFWRASRCSSHKGRLSAREDSWLVFNQPVPAATVRSHWRQAPAYNQAELNWRVTDVGGRSQTQGSCNARATAVPGSVVGKSTSAGPPEFKPHWYPSPALGPWASDQLQPWQSLVRPSQLRYLSVPASYFGVYKTKKSYTEWETQWSGVQFIDSTL